MRNKFALLTAALTLGASAANAHLIGPTQINQGANSNPDTEISAIESQTSLTDLVYLARFNFNDDGTAQAGEGTYASSFTVSSYSGDPAESTVTWNLTGSGFILEAVAVKTANKFLNLYTVSVDQQLIGLGDLVFAPDDKDSISHITFLGKRSTSVAVADGGMTLALMGLGLAGVGLARRRP